MTKAKRVPHFITSKKGEKQPQHVIFFDTETLTVPFAPEEKQQVLKLGWARYWRPQQAGDQITHEWCFFTTCAEFWSFVSDRLGQGKEFYLVAHNVSFDFRIVGGFEHAKQERWDLEFLYHKGMTTLINYRTEWGTLKLLDMGNFFPMSLAEIGKAVGLEKMAIDFDTCSFQELSDYCHNDVEILVRAWDTWLSFLDEHDLGEFKPTLAAQAMSTYRHNAMTHPIKIHNDSAVCQLEREAYKGGRIECFVIGALPGAEYYQLDVNGMYCYMMLQHDYPRLLKTWPLTLTLEQLGGALQHYCIIAQVVVRTDVPAFPFKMNGYNVYPVGIFKTVLTTPELEFALEHGEILKIGQVAIYEKAPIFHAYATYFADLKEYYSQQGNKPFREIAKKFANTLYGKFGQTDIETDLSFELPPIGPQEALFYDWRVHKWYRLYKIGDQTVFEKTGGESFNSFPAIPAHVTAYARMYLWSLIEKAGPDNVFYCATDSLIVNEQGYQNLMSTIDDHKLGYLKLETQARSLEIWGPNNFVLGDKLRSGGIRKGAVRLSHDVFQQDSFLGLRKAIRKGNPDLVTITKIKKQLHREIKTGVVSPGGKIVPFRFPL